MLFVALVLIPALTWLVWQLWQVKVIQTKTHNIPGPPCKWLFGNALEFITGDSHHSLMLMIKYFTEYGNCFRLWFLNEYFVINQDPKDLEIILTSPKFMNKSDDYDVLTPWLGRGLLLSTGHKWHVRRKAITTAFHFKILDNFMQDFIYHCQRLVDKIKADDLDTVHDVCPIMKRLGLDIICDTAMGTSCNSENESEQAYVLAAKKTTDIMLRRMYNPFHRPDFIYRFTKDYRDLQDLLKVLHNFTNSVIERRRKVHEEETTNNTDDNDQYFGQRRKMALLDMLLDIKIDGKGLENDEIREEVDTFMFAGHDTTSSAMAFLLYNLAKHQQIQAKVFEEIMSNVEDIKKVTTRELNGLKYLDLVIKENLRMYPSAPFIGRKIDEDMKINGKIFPANTNVNIGIYLLCHNPKIFPNPEQFLPERFEAEQTHPYNYIPFSAGLRNCIGQKFALFEMKVMVIFMLSAFRVQLADDNFKPILLADLILKSENGIKLKFQRR